MSIVLNADHRGSLRVEDRSYLDDSLIVTSYLGSCRGALLWSKHSSDYLSSPLVQSGVLYVWLISWTRHNGTQ